MPDNTEKKKITIMKPFCYKSLAAPSRAEHSPSRTSYCLGKKQQQLTAQM